MCVIFFNHLQLLLDNQFLKEEIVKLKKNPLVKGYAEEKTDDENLEIFAKLVATTSTSQVRPSIQGAIAGFFAAAEPAAAEPHVGTHICISET